MQMHQTRNGLTANPPLLIWVLALLVLVVARSAIALPEQPVAKEPCSQCIDSEVKTLLDAAPAAAEKARLGSPMTPEERAMAHALKSGNLDELARRWSAERCSEECGGTSGVRLPVRSSLTSTSALRPLAFDKPPSCCCSYETQTRSTETSALQTSSTQWIPRGQCAALLGECGAREQCDVD